MYTPINKIFCISIPVIILSEPVFFNKIYTVSIQVCTTQMENIIFVIENQIQILSYKKLQINQNIKVENPYLHILFSNPILFQTKSDTKNFFF